jgi:hypothetical protein
MQFRQPVPVRMGRRSVAHAQRDRRSLILPDPTCARSRSVGVFTTALALSWPGSKPRLRSGRCCTACPTCGSMRPINPTGDRRLSYAVSTNWLPVGRGPQQQRGLRRMRQTEVPPSPERKMWGSASGVVSVVPDARDELLAWPKLETFASERPSS